MTKLEAWKAWSATAGTDGTEFTLEKSSHGKAFSYAWDAAIAVEREACAQVVDDFGDEWMCDSHELAKIIRARGSHGHQDPTL